MKHHTALVTAASVMIVILAATAAIAANLGILANGTNTGEIGALTVSADPTTTVTTVAAPPAAILQIEDAAAQTTTATEPPAPAGDITAYSVAEAGVVTLTSDGASLTVVDLQPNDGWQTAVIPAKRGIEVGFVGPNGEVLLFAAQLNPDGTVETVVEDLRATPADDGNRVSDDDDEGKGDDDD